MDQNVSAFQAYGNKPSVPVPAKLSKKKNQNSPQQSEAAAAAAVAKSKRHPVSKGINKSKLNRLSHTEMVSHLIAMKKEKFNESPTAKKSKKKNKKQNGKAAASRPFVLKLNCAPTEADETIVEMAAIDNNTIMMTPTSKGHQLLSNGSDQLTPAIASANKKRKVTTNDQSSSSSPGKDSEPKPVSMSSSIVDGQQMFKWLINPIDLHTFMSTIWEKKPILVDRKCATYYADLISTSAIDRMLREQRVEFTKNIDVTSYKDGVRETHNPDGRAMPPTVWDFYGDGCSLRLLNPQTFLPKMHSMNATLQEYFQCMTGANVYLTPPNSQGFAPHYDDIEAFVLQVEGKKHWKVYKPRSASECLPRVSSRNFEQNEIGEPILDAVLEAGDMLYFPRGYIHQATTVPGHHSLHITLSVYQKHSYGDLLEVLMPMALQTAIDSDVQLRQGLPLDLWQCMGLVNSDQKSRARTEIIAKLHKCLDVVCRMAPFDDAVDRMAIRYQRDALPPLLSAAERSRTVYETSAVLAADGTIDHPMVELTTRLRLIRANVLRMVRHGEEFRIYYHTENSKEYHELEETFVEIEGVDAPAVEVLVSSYPAFITPKDFLLDDDERQLAVAQDLWERGILMTEDVLH